ncbi:MAG: AccI family restriction endonuclease [Verrucomicrobiota bacterium]
MQTDESGYQGQSSELPPRKPACPDQIGAQRRVAARECLVCSTVPVGGSRSPWSLASERKDMNRQSEHAFDRVLSVSMEDLAIILRGMGKAPWAEFLLNPRRLRGSDFLMRWSQGLWSEERLTQAVNSTGKYFALPYGPSGTAPDKDVRAFELYFERLEQAGLGHIKRPDLLVYRIQDKAKVDSAVRQLGGLSELPFTPEADAKMQDLLEHAVVAVECENSL